MLELGGDLVTNFIQELKWRNIFKVAGAYLVVGWLLIESSSTIVPMLGLSSAIPNIILFLVILGFPLALVFSWLFELTNDGFKRIKNMTPSESRASQNGKRLNQAIIVLLIVALGYFIWESRFEGGDVTPLVSEAEASIAVLPFSNLAGGGDDPFVAGLHDDLLTQLSKISGLKVISRTSVLEYKNTTKNMRQIGEELGVSTLLEGGLQKAGNRIRLNVQLINARTDEHIWAETYDRELTMDNIFDVQSEISAIIAGALRVAMTDEEKALIASVPTQNMDIYSAYLEIHNKDNRMEFEARANLIARLEELVRLDPNFALGFAELGKRYMDAYWWQGRDVAYRDKALEAIKAAFAKDDNLSEAHVAMAYYHYWGWLNFASAIDEADKALTINPNNAELYGVKGFALRRSGNLEGAIASLEKAQNLNPRSIEFLSDLAETYSYSHRFDEAGAMLDKIDQFTNNDDFGYEKLLRSRLILFYLGDGEPFLKIEVDENSSDFLVRNYLWALHYTGRLEEAWALFQKTYPDDMQVNEFGLNLDVLRAYYMNGLNRTAEATNFAHNAVSHLQNQLLNTPNSTFLLNHLLSQYLILGDFDEAEKTFARYEKLILATGDIYDEEVYYEKKAIYLSKLKDYDGAIEALYDYFKLPMARSLAYIEDDQSFNWLRENPRRSELIEAYGLTPKGAEALYPKNHPKYKPQRAEK